MCGANWGIFETMSCNIPDGAIQRERGQFKKAPMKEPFLKRPFDMLVSGIGLIASSWLWALISVAIIIEDGFPVLIRQSRIGKGGKMFDSFKFRSMKKHTLKEKINQQAMEHDSRATLIGRCLRKCAFDELPQLLNIFKGEMSFVGPRPLLSLENEVFSNGGCLYIKEIPGFEKRSTVRPGLTGIAQVYAERNIPRRHKFKYDLLYIRKMNLFLDFKLILLSFIISLYFIWERHTEKLRVLNRYRFK